jgi:adenine-specific DNA methylase
MAEEEPYAAGQRVHCRYEADNGNVVADHGRVKRVIRLGVPINGHKWRVEVRDLPGRDQVAYLLPGEDADWIKAAGFPPLSKTALQELAKQARKHGHYRNGAQVSLDCPRCRRRVNLVFSQYSGTLIQQLDEAVIRHLSDDEECVPEGGFQ